LFFNLSILLIILASTAGFSEPTHSPQFPYLLHPPSSVNSVSSPIPIEQHSMPINHQHSPHNLPSILELNVFHSLIFGYFSLFRSKIHHLKMKKTNLNLFERVRHFMLMNKEFDCQNQMNMENMLIKQ